MAHSTDLAGLPGDLLRPLLLGCTGKAHLHATAATALAHSREPGDVFSRIAADLLLAAWGENPFDGQCAALLAESLGRLPALPRVLIPALRSVMAHWQAEVTPEIRLAMAGRPADQLACITGQLRHAPRNLFWWHHLYEFCRIRGDWSPLSTALTPILLAPPEGLGPLFAYAQANVLLVSGDGLAAAGIYRDLEATLPLPLVRERLATAWLRSSRLDMGTGLLRECALARPWHVGLWLRLYELAVDGAHDRRPLPGRVMVLGYSWNKAVDLAVTLDSLARSELGEAQVRILDNGSTDTTAEVVRRFIDRVGSDRAALVRLPVNVGAPAARNWLMHLPEVVESDFAAYIDDDIALPPDWLLRLGCAVGRYPEAGVWGCKVVEFDGPARVQCGEHNLTPDPAGRERALMAPLMLQEADFGQADYIRPCASVTGCVHLFRTARLLKTGPFDLRFSPTQYDDLERDLRMVLGGGHAVYQGFLAIPHRRVSGAQSDVGGVQSAGATANMHKLMGKYAPEEFERMAGLMDRVLLADVTGKMRALGA
ncbi:MAG: glycosyltransferase [Pseudodesulfovibrio sp.]|uniref:Glycosyl transferase family 2 n=1 Tax=Pseudodesulfovibrio aespoeensis (strain ATCC 700646 / DSM 10631 / Aspo-2) TaxID=643562 RepID=E6VTS6_PSEA9|nr:MULTISPECIES: glycosyltransferase [Pseudodesulfovibrio]MBU4191705.1 glycosyltransferase [Pseudomonadota bacterium]ADU63363.1 glycosyl transferase family 2 [Pseudodesulfovibrio aespoeensis Aspo-2]MBU4245203.1 glycosyltransferase [Pseudomonadota bacterium]MBU4476036.1 glycosyltransferase [Pseudomonadota bacterium]MBU4517548.1 glycosyltransferase [Pseudomonadota bacterium]